MPVNLLVVARDGWNFPDPGSYAKGDIVEQRPDGEVWGLKETLPRFVRLRISNSNTGDLGWLQEDLSGDTLLNRRRVRVDPTEIDAIKAEWVINAETEEYRAPAPTELHRSYTRNQFNSRVVTRQ